MLNGTTLSNQAGINIAGNWDLPINSTGTIRNMATNCYLSVKTLDVDGYAVIEEANTTGNHPTSSALWERSFEDNSYFMLRNPDYMSYLTAYNHTASEPQKTFSIEGKN